ncbi:hypothetical protein V6N13_143212 [Hibiscus sabdariffa]
MVVESGGHWKREELEARERGTEEGKGKGLGGDKPICIKGDNQVHPTKCKEFMKPGLCKWDERKVYQVFSMKDAYRIMPCPIARARGMQKSGVTTRVATTLSTTRDPPVKDNNKDVGNVQNQDL